MPISVKHTFQTALPNDGTKDVSATRWNEAHTLTGVTAFAETILDDADAVTARTTLGLGTLATQSGTFSGTSSGTNTGDQTSIAGITGTKAQFNTAVTDDDFAYLAAANTFTAQNTFAAGTITTSQPLTVTQTWNDGAVPFVGKLNSFTSTASAAASLCEDWQVGGVSVLSISKAGKVSTPINGSLAYEVQVSGQNPVGIGRNGSVPALCLWGGAATPSSTNADMLIHTTAARFHSAIVFGWSASNASQNFDATILRAAPNSVQFAGIATAAGAVTGRTELNKSVAAIADAAATAVLTVTIPNAAHSAQLYVELCGSLGAGGAIGANEATATNAYTITFARTAGVNAVAGISAASGASSAAVAGAATVTCTAAMSAVTGAVGASNTFTVNVTITRSAGASANHTCLVYAKLLNANATGVTIA